MGNSILYVHVFKILYFINIYTCTKILFHRYLVFWKFWCLTKIYSRNTLMPSWSCSFHYYFSFCLLPHIFTTSLQKHINVLLRSSVPSNVEILICSFVLIQFMLDLWLNMILLFGPLSLLKIPRPLSLFKGASQSDYLHGLSCFTYHERLKRINIPWTPPPLFRFNMVLQNTV